MKYRFFSSAFAAASLLVACGDSDGSSGNTGSGGAGGTGGGAGASGAAGTAGSAGAGGSAGLSVTLPQAVDGAMLANSDVYAQIPLHVDVEGAASAVQVDLDGEKIAATNEDGDERWTASIPMAGREDATLTLTATAIGEDDATQAEASADFVVSARGAQITDFDDDGAAATPRLHRRGDEAWLTFADRSAGQREAYLWRVDGAGRTQGDRIALVQSAEEIQRARVAFGKNVIGILYQQNGGPYSNFFKIVDFDGNEVLAPIALDPMSMFGSAGGDIVHDGDSFVFVWRVNDGMGGGEVRWMRVEESGGTVHGPVVVAASGPIDPPTAMDPVGGFEPNSFVNVRVVGDQSLVTFVRGHYLAIVDFEIPKSQVAILDRTGNIAKSEYLGGLPELRFHRESRVFNADGGAFLLWSSSSLLDPDPNARIEFQGTLVSSEGTLDPQVRVVLSEVDERNEPFFVEHPGHFGVLLWLDHRSYTADILTGRIQLMVAPVSDTLAAGQHVVFEHADPIAGLAEVHAVNGGTNVLFTWIDDIGGIGNSRPEIYFDVGWF